MCLQTQAGVKIFVRRFLIQPWSLLFNFSKCLHVLGSMCVLCLCVCVCVLKPEANDSCLPLSVPVFFETRSLTEHRAHQLTNLPGQEGPEILQCPSQSTASARFADTSHNARLWSFLPHILLHVMLKLQDVQKLCPEFLDHPNQCRR